MDNDQTPPAPQPGAVFGAGSEQPPAPATSEPLVARAPEKPPKKNKKKLLIGLLLVLLLAGGVAYWYFVLNKDEPTPVVTQPADTPITAASGKFYVQKGSGELVEYNPVTNKQKTISLLIKQDASLANLIVGSNHPVMFSADGSKMLVVSQSFTGEGEGELAGWQLSLVEKGKSTPLVEVKAPINFADWLLTPDGKKVYYVTQQATDQADPKNTQVKKLYGLTAEDGKSAEIKGAFVEGHSNMTPLTIDKGGVLQFYSENGYKTPITRYYVTDNTLMSKALGTPTCACSFEFPQPISPDGKSILLEQIKDGQTGDFSYYLFSTANGKTTPFLTPEDKNTQWNPTFWSPNSSQIALSSFPFNADNEATNPYVAIVTVASKKQDKIMTTDHKEKAVQLMGWSPDGRLLAVVDASNKLIVYDTVNKSSATIDIKIEDFQAFGWY